MSKKRKNMELPEVMEMIKNGSLSKEIAKLLAPHGFPPTNDKDKKFFLQLIDALMSPAPTRTPKKQKPIEKPKILSDQRIAKNPKKFSGLTLELFSNVGFSYKDYEGQTNERGILEHIFANKRGQRALLPQSKISSLIKKQKERQGLLFPPPPDATVSQLKNIHTLIILLDRQNKERTGRGEDKTNVIDFYLKEYEEARGKTEAELAKRGKFRDLFRYTLVSGGITTFISENEHYYKIRHHHLYDIDIPKNPKEKWFVYINKPYAEALLNLEQYTPIFLKAIQDPQTDHNKGYLYFFLMTVLHYSNNRHTGFKTQMKVSTLLEKIKIGERVENRPSEAFRVLAECISYVADNYKDVLSEIRLLNSKYEVRVIRNLSIFKNIDYEQLKENYLNDLGIKDIREALISFNTPPQELKEFPAGGEKTGQTGQNRTEL